MSAPLRADVELDAGDLGFASGLLVRIVDALQRTPDGGLLAIEGATALAEDLERWSRLTGHALVASTASDDARTRWVVRRGAAPREGDARPVGERLWLYTNFDCNLRCDYCCVRSSPSAPREALGLERVERIAAEGAGLGVREIFLTGGEPFLLADIAAQATAAARAAPTTLLTNGMLFRGARLEALRAMPRDRVTLQISLDSATPPRHELHRGAGSWAKAWEGVQIARAEGFRVRLAATVHGAAEEEELRAFFDKEGIAEADRIVRRVALRGFATEGVALARADLVPEITIAARGVYWHPVGAADDDMLVTRDIFPLARAFEAMRRALADVRAFDDRVASVFHCA